MIMYGRPMTARLRVLRRRRDQPADGLHVPCFPAPLRACSPDSETTPRQRTDIWIVLAPAVLALFLSVLFSWRPSYWLDETVTVASTVGPVSELGSVLRHADAVHGLYYLLMHSWAQVSVAEWWT
jgi:hypothetical protein